MNPGESIGATELEAIAPWRARDWFQRQRHTRKCQGCGAWLAVDQPHPSLCSPCQIAAERNNPAGRRSETVETVESEKLA